MVLGAIVNWVVFRTLDFTTNAIWWATKTTVYGVYSVGHYMIVPRPQAESFEMIPLMITGKENENEKELIFIKEQNELLKEEVELLKTITTSFINSKNENKNENNQLSII